jgi:hypothetical protein
MYMYSAFFTKIFGEIQSNSPLKIVCFFPPQSQNFPPYGSQNLPASGIFQYALDYFPFLLICEEIKFPSNCICPHPKGIDPLPPKVKKKTH